MSGPVKIQADDPRETLALACYALGFRPLDCLVLIGIGDQGAVTVTRADTPRPDDALAAVPLMTPALLRQNAVGVVALLFTRTDPPLTATDRRRAETVAARLDGHGLAVADLVWVGPTRYRSLFCADNGCCPPDGRQVSLALTDTAVAATRVSAGDTVEPERDALIADTRPRDVLPADTLAATEVQEVRAWLASWAGWLHAQPGDIDWPQVLAGLQRPRYRDAIMFAALAPDHRGDGTAPDTWLDAGQDQLDRLLSRRPDPDSVRATTTLLAAVTAHAPAGWRAAPLAAGAFLSWQLGDGVRARLLADAATTDEPAHPLARVITVALDAGIPPAWANPAH